MRVIVVHMKHSYVFAGQVFFVIRLHAVAAACDLGPIIDPDPLINNDLMDGRVDAFLTLSRDKHYEFSSLRRTKFSTIGMLYELHTQSRGDSFVYTCNACRANVETRYHCSICDVRHFAPLCISLCVCLMLHFVCLVVF